MLDHSFLETQMYVAVLAEEGSFSRAAQRLRTSQSFLTRKIADLEKNLGAKIFVRSTRRLELTVAGRLLLPDVQLSLRHAERAWELARCHGRKENGPIRIGYSPYTHGTLMPMLHRLDVSEIEARRVGATDGSGPRLVFESGGTLELIERVLRGKLLVAFGVQPVQDRELWIEPVACEPFCVCVPKNHGLARRPSLGAKDLHGQLLFWIPRNLHPEFYDHTVEYIQSTGANPVLHEVRSAAQAIEIVSHGSGLALLPNVAARLSHTGVVFKPVSDRFLRIETVMFARKELLRGQLQNFALWLLSKLQNLRSAA